MLPTKYLKLICHGCTAHVVDLFMRRMGSPLERAAVVEIVKRANSVVLYFHFQGTRATRTVKAVASRHQS